MQQNKPPNEVTTHPDGFHCRFGHWSCSLCPQPFNRWLCLVSTLQGKVRLGQKWPEKVWWFRDIPSFMASCTLVSKVHQGLALVPTRRVDFRDHHWMITCATVGHVGHVGHVEMSSWARQDANIVADASFLRSGMDGHLDQWCPDCKESRNPSAVCILGCIGPTTLRVDTKCDLESIQLSRWNCLLMRILM